MYHCLFQSEAVSHLLLYFLQKSNINQSYWEEIKIWSHKQEGQKYYHRDDGSFYTQTTTLLMSPDCSAQTMQLFEWLNLLWRFQFVYALVMLSSSDPELFFILSTTWFSFLFNVFPLFGFDSLWKISTLKYNAIVNVIFRRVYHSQVGLDTSRLLVCELHYCKVCLQMLRGKREKQTDARGWKCWCH